MIFTVKKRIIRNRINRISFLNILIKEPKPDARKILEEFYLKQPIQIKMPLHKEFDTLSSVSRALGDAINSASFSKQAFLQGKKRYLLTRNGFNSRLSKFDKYINLGSGLNIIKGEDIANYNVGNGNIAQWFQRALGLIPNLSGTAEWDLNVKKDPYKIGICFITGTSAFHKTNYRAPRQLFPENREIIQEFINENPQFKFVEFGKESIKLNGVDTNFIGKTIEESILEAATCEYAIVLNTGLMHVFSAVGAKVIVLINIPKPNYCYLPILRSNDFEDLSWLSAKNVHLHQEGGNPLCPHFDKYNLQKAINGEIYPYWNDKYLDMIFDKKWIK